MESLQPQNPHQLPSLGAHEDLERHGKGYRRMIAVSPAAAPGCDLEEIVAFTLQSSSDG